MLVGVSQASLAGEVSPANTAPQQHSQVFSIRVFMDGDQWCALIGTDLQSGNAGWGNSPEAAIADLAKVLQELKDLAGRSMPRQTPTTLNNICRYLSIFVAVLLYSVFLACLVKNMKKEEAAKFLGVTVRSLERYTQQGKLGIRYIKGKTRTIANYDKIELARFKIELDQAIHKPMIENLDNTDNTVAELSRLSSNLTTNIVNEQLLVLESLSELLGAFIEYQSKNESIPPQHKLLLTLAEAQALTGINRKVLRADINAGFLKAKIIGKAWRVKRADLESYIKLLF